MIDWQRSIEGVSVAVERMDQLSRNRPDLADKVRTGDLKSAAAIREMKRDEVVTKLGTAIVDCPPVLLVKRRQTTIPEVTEMIPARAYTDIETATALGYRHLSDWLKARRKGHVPQPALTNPDRWTEAQIRQELCMNAKNEPCQAEELRKLDAFLGLPYR
ncbi:MAG: hypothetical protein AAFY56_21005 [Pseudomonadota bacterium]